MMRALLTRSAAVTLSLVLVFSAYAIPKPAQAQMAVIDSAVLATVNAILGTNAAELNIDQVLDGVAWQLANTVLESMSRSVVNWINSGFEGSPAFVQDLNQNLRGVADAVAAEFIGQLADQMMDTPLSGTVEAVAYGYYLSTNGDAFLREQLYTLRDTVEDDLAFTGGDFNSGGWRGWFALTGNRANNPHGAYLNAKDELDRRIEASLNKRITELGWGNGFLSWRGECGDRQTTTGSDGRINAPVPAVNLGGEEFCADAPIETPGSVIEKQLNETLAGGQQRLQVADEINEIVNALVSQLVSQALQGLSSIGSRSSGGSGYIDRPGTPTPVTPPATPIGGSVDDLLISGVQGQVTLLASYQTDWQKIEAVASSTLACDESTDAEKVQATDAKARADTALSRVAVSLAALQAITVEIMQARTGANPTAIVTIAQDFQALMTNPATPSSTEVAEAGALAAEEGTPASLYMELRTSSLRCTPTS